MHTFNIYSILSEKEGATSKYNQSFQEKSNTKTAKRKKNLELSEIIKRTGSEARHRLFVEKAGNQLLNVKVKVKEATNVTLSGKRESGTER